MAIEKEDLVCAPGASDRTAEGEPERIGLVDPGRRAILLVQPRHRIPARPLRDLVAGAVKSVRPALRYGGNLDATRPPKLRLVARRDDANLGDGVRVQLQKLSVVADIAGGPAADL